MEISDTEAEQTFRSPPRRRRSTFFERRDSVAPQLSENVELEGYKKDVDTKMRTREMSRYYEKLLTEKEQWKREANERRNKYHDIRQQYEMAITAPGRSRMSYAALSNDDIEFLKAKPNLSKLVDCQQRLHKSIKYTMDVVRIANKQDEILMNYCEDKVQRITKYILENSTVD